MPAGALIKAIPVIVEERGPVLVLVRGDHRLNEIKLQNALGAPFAGRRGGGGARACSAPSPASSARSGARVEVLADEALRGLHGLVAGANEPDVHLRGVEPGRDFEPTWVGRPPGRGGRHLTRAAAAIRIEPAIEVGNIFKLGTRYSEPLGASYLDEQGKEQLIWMGSYGIGPARIVAAAIEQFADEQGISWPRGARAVRRGARDARQGGRGGARRSPTGSTTSCASRPRRALRRPRREPGREVRRRRAARLPAAADGRQARASRPGEIEAQVRRGREKRSLPLEGAAEAAAELWRSLP